MEKIFKGPVRYLAEKCAGIMISGGVAVYPTDTVYGIGGNAENPKVCERISLIKKRHNSKPFSAIFKDIDHIKEYCCVSETQEQFLKEYLPGAYTFILKSNSLIPISKNGFIGVRIPDSRFTKIMMSLIDFPVVSTSANLSGMPPPKSSSEISENVISLCDAAFFLDSGLSGKPSKVIDISKGSFVILRE